MTFQAKSAFAVMIFGIAITLYAWWPTVVHLLQLIQNVDVFAHGQVVPLVSIVLIWSRREALRSMEPVYSGLGLIVLIGAVVIWLGGELLDSALLAHVGLITAIQGIVLFSFGVKIYRAILFPMAFLYLMVPFGYALVTHLQYLTADMVILVLDIIGADFTADGVLIELPSGLYEVAQACAGIRFLFTSVVTSVLLANLVFRSWQRRVMILCVGIVLPIIANIIRVLSILAIAEMTDQSFAKDVDHIIYGWVFLSIVLLALISFAYKVSDVDDSAPQPHTDVQQDNSSKKNTVSGVVVFLLPLLATYVFPNQFETIYQEGEQESSALYDEPPLGFRLINDMTLTPTPRFLNADVVRISILRENSVVFSVYSARYDNLGPGRRLYQAGNSMTDSDWEELTGYRRQTISVCNLHIEDRTYRRGDVSILVRSLFRLNKNNISNSLEEKLLSAYARLNQTPAVGEAIVLTAPISGDVEIVRSAFDEFLKTNLFQENLWGSNNAEMKGADSCAG